MTLAQLMSPMTPHLAEDIWALHQGGDGLVMQRRPGRRPMRRCWWIDTVTLPIQINGKRRAEINVPAEMSRAEVEALVLGHPAVLKALDGGTPKKLIVVPGRIVNVVV